MIQLRTHQQDHADDIQPQHQYDNRRQRAVQHRIPRHIVHIERKSKRDQNPRYQREQRPRPHLTEPKVQIGHDLVEQHEEHKNKRDHHPEAGIVQSVHHSRRHRQIFRYNADDGSSGDDEHKAAHNRNKKARRNTERNEHVLDHAARDFNVVNIVDRAHH